ncbi:MAG: PEP-CTERM sorting domain-containing protein [Methylophilaceae bacterium]
MKHLNLLVFVGSLMVNLLSPQLSQAATYDEAINGDLSNDRLNPSFLALTDSPVGANGLSGNNIISGRIGAVNGVVDRDYLHIIVPTGYVWSELRLGNQTTVGGNGSFIGLAAGSTIPIPPNAINASGLLGYKVYGAADLSNNILNAMAVSGNGSSGFNSPLGAGDYTLWIQELATGNFNYRFNLIITAVPEANTYIMLLVGLVLTGFAARRKTIE